MDFMLYPTFEFIENRGWFPWINLPEDYKGLVPEFYKQERKNTIEKYAKMVEERFIGRLEIRLQWDKEEGLTNINVGFGAGLDLNKQIAPHFCEHNLNTTTSLMTGMIAMKYISELYKSKKLIK
ncbi:MAG: hypothetical protein M1416_03120 [Candidatus Pacearchaeota archaeon]|nr:hypothetical protein [Candidatus Pacearchaeota archaeon]